MSVMIYHFKLDQESGLPPFVDKVRIELTLYGVIDGDSQLAQLLDTITAENLDIPEAIARLRSEQEAINDYLESLFLNFDPSKIQPEDIDISVGEIAG